MIKIILQFNFRLSSLLTVLILRQVYFNWSLVYVPMRLLLTNRLLLQSDCSQLLLKLLLVLILRASAYTRFLLTRVHLLALTWVLQLIGWWYNRFGRLNRLLLHLSVIPLRCSSWPNIQINSAWRLIWLVKWTSHRWFLLSEDLFARASWGLGHVVIELWTSGLWIVEDLLGATWRWHSCGYRHLFLLFNQRDRDLLSLAEMSSFFHVFFQGWAILSSWSMVINFLYLLNVDSLVLEALFVACWTSSVESRWVYLNGLLECLIAWVSDFLGWRRLLVKELLHEKLNSSVLLLLSALCTSTTSLVDNEGLSLVKWRDLSHISLYYLNLLLLNRNWGLEWLSCILLLLLLLQK